MTEISFAKTSSLDTTFELTNPTSDVAYRGSFSRANSGDLQGPLAAQEGNVSENDPLNRIRVPVSRYIVTMWYASTIHNANNDRVPVILHI